MKHILILILFFTFSLPGKAQVENSSSTTLTCDPFNPEDTTGQMVWELVNRYEIYSHFAKENEMRGNKSYAEGLKSLFNEQAMVPNDLNPTSLEQLLQQVSIKDYASSGLAKGGQKFFLVTEKKLFEASRSTDSEDYIGYVRVFKIFSDTARLKKEYDLGVMYEMEIRLWGDSLQAEISNITLVDNKIYEHYMLSGFGYHGNSDLLITNNISSLLTYKEPPKPKVPKQTKSGFFLHGGYLFTNYLYPENITGNQNPNTSYSGTEYGYVAGLQYQKVYGEKGFFGILFGVEYEIDYYDFEYNNIRLNYTLDCDGNTLKDLEGNLYESKQVDVSSYAEKGEISLIRPEVGLFFNLGLGKGANLQLFGLVGNAFISSKSYDATATVSYTGYANGLELTDRPELGFYNDLQVDFSNDLANLQGFMFYRLGASLDLNLSKWLAFSILGEYRGSMTYALRFREFNCAFLDPNDPRTFVSKFDYTNVSRFYDAFGIQAGFKIYIKEKKKQ
jgi:hypothetical protein